MDRHSHSKNDLSLAIPGHSATDITKCTDSAGSGHFALCEVAELRRSFRATSRGAFMISRAYSEPVGSDPVEEFILQRNYIID